MSYNPWIDGVAKDTINSFQPEPLESVATASMSRQQLLQRLEAARDGAKAFRVDRDYARDALFAIADSAGVQVYDRCGGVTWDYATVEKVKDAVLSMADEVADLRRINRHNRMILLRANYLDGAGIPIINEKDAA